MRSPRGAYAAQQYLPRVMVRRALQEQQNRELPQVRGAGAAIWALMPASAIGAASPAALCQTVALAIDPALSLPCCIVPDGCPGKRLCKLRLRATQTLRHVCTGAQIPGVMHARHRAQVGQHSVDCVVTILRGQTLLLCGNELNRCQPRLQAEDAIKPPGARHAAPPITR